MMSYPFYNNGAEGGRSHLLLSPLKRNALKGRDGILVVFIFRPRRPWHLAEAG